MVGKKLPRPKEAWYTKLTAADIFIKNAGSVFCLVDLRWQSLSW